MTTSVVSVGDVNCAWRSAETWPSRPAIDAMFTRCPFDDFSSLGSIRSVSATVPL